MIVGVLSIWYFLHPPMSDVSPPELSNRRPIKTRSALWAGKMARGLASHGLTPNMVSVGSVLISGIGACLFIVSPKVDLSQAVYCYVGAAIFIQLRLLLNMLDGLMAVEGNMKSPTGILYNELPDRIADVLFLVAAGYSISCGNVGIALGWAAGVTAVSTAYIRCLGGALGFEQDFCGPIAKPQRMFFLTLGSLGAAIEAGFFESRVYCIAATLILVIVGSSITCIRRTSRIASALNRNA